MIRAAAPGDAPAIAALWNHAIRETAITFNATEKSDADVAATIADRQAAGRAFLVAEVGQGLLGFVTYDQFRGGVGYRFSMEHTIHLAPQARGQGLGRALMTAMEDHARGAGVHAMLAGVSSENPEGQAFHAAIGYHLVGTLPEVGHKFGRWMHLLLMQKILS